MSEKNSVLKFEQSEKSLKVRAPRFDQVSQNLGLQVKIGSERCKVINISESGLALETKNSSLFKTGDRIEMSVLISGEKSIYDGTALVVWVNPNEDHYYVALEFRSQLLSRDLIRALDLGDAILNTVETQQSQFTNMPEEFKALVYEIKNYMKNLKAQFDVIEEKMTLESLESNQSLLKALDLRVGPRVAEQLLHFSGRLINFLDLLKDPLNKKLLTDFFHTELNEFYLTSPYAQRASVKPLGYAGDFEMMNQIYRNNYEGNSLFAKLIHHYTVNETAGKSVRLRKEKLKKHIIEISAQSEGSICSLACGPAQEVADFLETYNPTNGQKLNIVLVDQDVEALVFAKRNISQILLRKNLGVNISYVCASVKDILEQNSRASLLKSHKFDLIYSAGLFDYLSNSVAKLMLMEVTGYLAKNGRLIVGNFHPNNPTRGICEFSVDWKLIHRTEVEMLSLAPNSANLQTKAHLDELGIVTYLEIVTDAA